MKVYVDADSCPRKARDYVLRRGETLGFEVFFVANRKIDGIPEGNMVLCPQERDSADDYIAQNADVSDIVITKDILLAERLVKKDVRTMNDRGLLFSHDNITGLVEDRKYSLDLSSIGFRSPRKRRYTSSHFAKFTELFKREVLSVRRLM